MWPYVGQCVKNGGITLCTDNYTLTEVELLIKALVNRYNLNCSIHYKKGKAEKLYYRIYLGINSFDKLKPLIIEHVHKNFYINYTLKIIIPKYLGYLYHNYDIGGFL